MCGGGQNLVPSRCVVVFAEHEIHEFWTLFSFHWKDPSETTCEYGPGDRNRNGKGQRRQLLVWYRSSEASSLVEYEVCPFEIGTSSASRPKINQFPRSWYQIEDLHLLLHVMGFSSHFLSFPRIHDVVYVETSQTFGGAFKLSRCSNSTLHSDQM